MKKIGVIFGGMSTEHEISIKSAMSVIENLDKKKYNIEKIYIDKNGIFKLYDNMQNIENVMNYLKTFDVIFPVLHGLYGEDGTLQGLLELIKVPYVGCKVFASACCMDKTCSKIIFDKANLNQAKYMYFKIFSNKNILIDNNFEEIEIEDSNLVKCIENTLKYPMFVKPSNSGSSVGIKKVKNGFELKDAIKNAAKYDYKILIEEAINGREIECAVLGNSKNGIFTSIVGEAISAEEFYTFSGKYQNSMSKVEIPANIDDNIASSIQKLAKKAFIAVDGSGLSRVDFFIEKGTNKIFINEINTMPGFTSISMYPKLMEKTGYSYSKLLDTLIELA